jgi:hypothetical protein
MYHKGSRMMMRKLGGANDVFLCIFVQVTLMKWRRIKGVEQLRQPVDVYLNRRLDI